MRRTHLFPCRSFQPLTIPGQTLAGGTVGVFYSQQLNATGGTPPYTWTLVSNTGANTWNVSASGILSGTPGSAETDVITIKVTDSGTPVATATAALPLTVIPASGSYTFTYFISPLGNDANDGKSAVQGTGVHGPWSLGSLRDPTYGGATVLQKSNNALMAGVAVGIVGDQGPLTFSGAGFSYPLVIGVSGNALSVPSGTSAANPTVVASCNSSAQYVRGLAVIDGQCDGSQNTGLNMIGRFSLATDCQYITIDGLEVKNGMSGGIVLGQSGPLGTNLPGWVIKNNYIHHIYNSSEGFSATGCSQSGTSVTIGAIVSGSVYATAGNGDSLFGAGFPASRLTGQVSGVPGGAGVYTSTASATVAGPVNLTGSMYAGNNTAGIHTHGSAGQIITNNFISDIIDLNTALPNNQRVDGMKFWTAINSTCTFNTIYAPVASGYPTGGIEHKNVPQYNNVIQNNYIHLANAANFTGVDIISLAGDADGVGKPIPAGSFYTVSNNIIINNPQGQFGFPPVAGGFASQSAAVNWYANTMIASAGHSSFGRFFPAAQLLLTYHDNVLDRPTPSAGGNGGDWRTNVDVVSLIDFNLYPANYLLVSTPSGAGSPGTQYSASPPQNGGIAGLMTALSTATGGATQGLESNGGAGPEIGTPVYANASGTKLKASDWQLATGSPGQGKGRIGGVPAGTVVDKGAWGGQTQVGCNFRDPSG